MNKRLINILLVLSSASLLTLASCDNSKDSSEDSSTVELNDMTTKEIGVAYVGDKLNLRDYFISDPKDAPFTVTSSNKNVATINGDTLEIVGIGETVLTAVGARSAGRMKVKTLSQNAKSLKDMADSLQDHYRFDGESHTYNGATIDTGIDTDYDQTYYIVKNPRYCYDGYWTWSGNSYYKLCKLKDKTGTERSYQFVLDDITSHNVNDLTFTRRNYSAAYEEDCFYMDGEVVMPISKFSDDGDGVTTTDWKTMSDFYCSLGGGYSYSGDWKVPGIYEFEKLTFTKTSDGKGLHFELGVVTDYGEDYIFYNTISGDFTQIGTASIPLLESYISSGETPCSSDITPIVEAFGKYQESGNYKIDYRAGWMLSETNHDWYEGNFWHTDIYEPDEGRTDLSMFDMVGTAQRTKNAVIIDEHDERKDPVYYKYGYQADEEGLGMLSYNTETGKYKKGTVYNDEIHSLENMLQWNMNVFTENLLRAVDPYPTGENEYRLDGRLDDGYMSAYIDCLAGQQEIYGYLSYSNWYGSYTTAYMELKDDEIDFFAAVRYSDYIYGVEVKLYGLNEVVIDIE